MGTPNREPQEYSIPLNRTTNQPGSELVGLFDMCLTYRLGKDPVAGVSCSRNTMKYTDPGNHIPTIFLGFPVWGSQ